MRKLIIFTVLLMLLSTSAHAFLYEIKLLTPQEIGELSDEELVSVYMEAKIEQTTSAEFHEGAGFSSAQEYYKRKDLLRFIIYLHQEMLERGIQADPIDVWLR